MGPVATTYSMSNVSDPILSLVFCERSFRGHFRRKPCCSSSSVFFVFPFSFSLFPFLFLFAVSPRRTKNRWPTRDSIRSLRFSSPELLAPGMRRSDMQGVARRQVPPTPAQTFAAGEHATLGFGHLGLFRIVQDSRHAWPTSDLLVDLVAGRAVEDSRQLCAESPLCGFDVLVLPGSEFGD